jgi:hypothetical protein
MGGKINNQGRWINQGTRVKALWFVGTVSICLGGIGSALAVAPTPAFTWDATGTSDYNTPTNWDPDLAAAPDNGSNQFLTINNGATAAINGDSQGAFLILGLSTGQSGNLVINSGTSTFGEIRIGGRETVPDDYNSAMPNFIANNGGTGTVIQNPGTTVNVTYAATSEPPVASFYVGDSSGLAGNTANGSYTINGTADAPSVLQSGFQTNDAIVVGTGLGTVATFTQNAFTTVTSAGFINIGRRGSTGTYNLNGGTLNANAGGLNTALFIGDGDTTGVTPTSGTFNQSGGTFNVNGVTLIGRRNGEGTYNISGGSFISTGEVRVPDLGSNTAGLGNAKGTLAISGTASFTVGTNLNIGLSNTTVTSSGVVGILTQTGGTLNLPASNAIFAIGNGNISSATATLSGGTISVLGATSVIDIGRNNAPGTFNISGTGILNAHQITVDSTSVAVNRTLNISGGTVDLDILTLGTVASLSTRLVDISGGTVNIGDLTTGQATGAGSALTYIHGGTVTLETSVQYFTGSTFRLGTINLSVGAMTTYGNGTVDVLAGSTLTQTGSFGTNATSRTLTKTGPGTMTIAGTQTYAATAATMISGGTINYNVPATGTNLTVTVGSAGTLGGNGTVGGAVTNNGTIAPGVASGTNIGTLTTNAGVTDGANSNWAFELNGATSDQLVVNGNINLSAVDTLNVSGSPGSSTSWIIGTYTGTVTGVFDTVTPGYSVTYTGGNITLNLAGLPGDFNSDGKVDAGDYATWRKNDGPNAALPNDNGVGNQAARFSLWRANFGKPPGSGSGLGGTAVPEPATCALLCILVSLLGTRRFNRVRV